MDNQLKGKKIAILAMDGVEQSELREPMRALQEAGAETILISPQSGEIKAWQKKEWADTFRVDVTLDNVTADDYDALLLPGGTLNADKLRMEEKAVQFVQKFFEDGKPAAAICHGPWLLVEADVVNGRKLTSYPSLQTDLRNAGAQWVDEEVVVDQGLVTSRNPDDIPAFIQKMIEEFIEGPHARQQA